MFSFSLFDARFIIFTFYSFQQLTIILLTLHYVGDALLHGARLVHFISQNEKKTRCKLLIIDLSYITSELAYLH